MEDSTLGASLPVITEMRVIPVAGHDGMLLNLSGAHAPFFTRNLVLLKDNAGHTGVGEVPGGEKIRQLLEDSRALVRVAAYRHSIFAPPFTPSLQLKRRCSTCWDSIWSCPSLPCWVKVSNAPAWMFSATCFTSGIERRQICRIAMSATQPIRGSGCGMKRL
jgi:hypothetical protein